MRFISYKDLQIKMVYFLIISYILIGNFSISGITIYLAILVATGIMAFLHMIRSGKIDTGGYSNLKKKYTLTCIISIFYFTCVYFLWFQFEIDTILLISMSMLVSEAIAYSIKDENQIRNLMYILVFCITISSIVLIGQALNISAAYRLIDLLGANNAKSYEMSIYDSRFYGLAKDTLYFGYQCAFAIAIILFVKPAKNNIFFKYFRLICLLICMMALLFNRTRSAQLAVLLTFGVWLFIFLFKNNRYIIFKWIFFIASICFVLYAFRFIDLNYLNNALRIEDSGAGTTARIPMLLTAINHSFHYPFGMGVYKVNPDLVIGAVGKEVSYVLNNPPHNFIGNCLVSYGWIGLLLMIFTAFFVYKQLLCSYHNKNEDLKRGILWASLSLIINAMMHNSYLYNGELLIWILWGCGFALQRIENRRDNNERYLWK